MRLPRRLPEKNEHRVMLGEFYDIHKGKRWFDKAEFVEQEPKSKIQVYCCVIPSELELHNVVRFGEARNLTIEIINSCG